MRTPPRTLNPKMFYFSFIQSISHQYGITSELQGDLPRHPSTTSQSSSYNSPIIQGQKNMVDAKNVVIHLCAGVPCWCHRETTLSLSLIYGQRTQRRPKANHQNPWRGKSPCLKLHKRQWHWKTKCSSVFIFCNEHKLQKLTSAWVFLSFVDFFKDWYIFFFFFPFPCFCRIQVFMEF